MGDPYTDVTVLNYNDNAPADDGSEVPANRVNWSTVKDEIGDPLKTAIESVNTNVGGAFDKIVGGAGITSTTAPYTVQAGDQGKLVVVTSAGTVTTATAATVGAPFVHAVLNNSSGTVTIDGAGSETVDGQTTIDLPAGSGVILYNSGTAWFTTGRGRVQGSSSYVEALPRSYLAGLKLSNNGTDAQHDIDISAGECKDAADSFDFSNSASHTKRIDASWASGTGNGGRASAVSLTADTTYHVFAVDDGSSGTEFGFDTSVTATNLLSDTGGSKYRRIGSVITDGSANILGFTQKGDWFVYDTPPALSVNDATPGTTANTGTLDTPNGIITTAIVNGLIASEDQTVYLSAITSADVAASTTASPLGTLGDDAPNPAFVITNTSRQIRYRATTNAAVRIATIGWIDERGRDD